jgi:hypothetical protein
MADLFAQLEVDMVRDPAMRRAGPLPRLLYIQTMCWSKENETDGKVEPWFAQEVAADIPDHAEHFDKLVSVGLMEAMPDGGWRIPLAVWVKRNPTKQDLEALRRKKSEAGKRGGHSKWHSAENAHDWCDYCHEAGYLVERVEPHDESDGEPMAPAMAPAMTDGWQGDGKSIARTTDLIPDTPECHPIVRDDLTGPVDSSADDDEFQGRRERIIRLEINRRARESKKPIPASRRPNWDKKVRENLEKDHGAELDRCLREYPNAPDSAITARAIYGDTSNRLSEYQPTNNETSAA